MLKYEYVGVKMNKDRRSEINEKLNIVITEFNLNENIPVNLKSIADNHKIILQETDNYKDGKLEYQEFTKSYVISYVSSEYNWRHNFTIAHELGHYFLDHLDIVKSNVIYRDDANNENNYLEEEANYFAAGLLVPQESFKNNYTKLLEKGCTFNTICKELSELYQVSTAVIENRFKNRGLYN